MDIVYEFPITEALILNIRQSQGGKLPLTEEGSVMILPNFGNY